MYEASVEQVGVASTPSGEEVLLGAAFDVLGAAFDSTLKPSFLGLDFFFSRGLNDPGSSSY